MIVDQRRRGAIFVATAALLWGLWPLWVRLGPGGAITATIGLLVAGVACLPLALRSSLGRSGPARPAAAWIGLGLLGLSDAGNAWCYFRALKGGIVAPAVLSHYLAPVIVAALAPLLLGEPRSRRTPLALVLTLGGTATMVLLGGSTTGAASGVALRAALLLGSLSALFYAGNVLLSKWISRWWSDAEMMSYHALFSGTLLALATGLPLVAGAWLWATVGGLVSALAAGLIYYAGLRRLPAERAGILTYLEPLAACLVGWIALGEPPTWGTALGGPLILLGGLLVATAPNTDTAAA